METIAPGTVQAILEGGPNRISAEQRIQQVNPFNDKIKLPHWGGYEHFERVGSPEACATTQQLVYRWTMRTEVAE